MITNWEENANNWKELAHRWRDIAYRLHTQSQKWELVADRLIEGHEYAHDKYKRAKGTNIRKKDIPDFR